MVVLLDKRAQGTLEYLIILSVVLIIAIVVSTQLLKFGSNTQINKQQSEQYWLSATPLSFKLSVSNITPSGTFLAVRNTLSESLTVSDINFNGVPIGAAPVTISAGADKTITGSGVTCSPGETYAYKVTFKYKPETFNDQNAFTFTSTTNLVGNCAG